jgi:outer membrane protein assembly factor BamA
MRQVILVVLLLTSGFPPAAAPQSSPTGPKLGAIHFKGLQHFTEAQVLAAVDLQPGAVFARDRLDTATQILAQSGAFQEVRYNYRPEAGAMTVEFAVKEVARFHRCAFDNFVWMQDSELQSLLREKIPFYDGSAPESGTILAEISAVLEGVARSHHISGAVNRIQYGGLGDPHWEHLFSFAGPAIKVTSLRFAGTQAIEEGALVREGKPLIGRDYSMVQCREYGRATFPDYYRERGYLKVEVAEPSAQIAKHTEGSDSFDIQVSYPVAEGSAYQWNGAQWEANRVYPGQDLDRFMGMKSGEIANAKKIEAGWEAIRNEYGKQGYIEAQLEHNAIFDDANRRVLYHVLFNEGEQYRMGSFSMAGFPPDIAAKVQSRWRLKPGEVFDASYLSDFFKKELVPALAKYGSKLPKITSNETPNRTQRIVDVSLRVE